MKKLLIIPVLFLFSFTQKTKKDYWVLVGSVQDFIILKDAVNGNVSDSMKKEVLNWIDYKLQRLK